MGFQNTYKHEFEDDSQSTGYLEAELAINRSKQAKLKTLLAQRTTIDFPIASGSEAEIAGAENELQDLKTREDKLKELISRVGR